MPNPLRQSIPVAQGALVAVGADQPVEIGCDAGSLWITQDNDIRDVVLDAGERFVSDRRGTILVYALRPAVLSVPAGVRRAESFWSTLLHRLRPSGMGRRLAMS